MPSRKLTVSYIYVRKRERPYVRLGGKWLAEALGVKPGDQVTVHCVGRHIMITKEDSR